MFKTTKGNANTLTTLRTLLTVHKAKLVVDNLDTNYRGVVVTDSFVRPANYNSQVVYWLSNARQDSLFVPIARCQANKNSERLYMLKDNDAVLINNLNSIMQLINLGYKLVVPMSNPGFGSIIINSLMLVGKSIRKAEKPYYHASDVLVVPLTNVIFEDSQMEDLSAILFGEDLYAVAVTFRNTNCQRYNYKSTVEYKPGANVVVDTPSNGLQVVTVVDCQRGLPLDTNFQHYKWIVAGVDMSNYNNLVKREQEFVEHAKLAKKKRDAIAKLAELGVTPEEFKQALGL